MTKILIATPTSARVNVTSPKFNNSMINLIAALERSRIPWLTASQDGHDICTQRDYLAHLFLMSDFTHLLFIDDDMVFEPILAPELLALKRELVGAAYTSRELNLARLEAEIAKGLPFKTALARAYKFNVTPLPSGKIDRMEGDPCFKVGEIGMGFTLIARSAFERIKGRPTYRAEYGNGPIVTDYFSRMPGSHELRKTEDYAFCRRFTDAGGSVFAYPTDKIGHIGEMVYRANFADHV